MATAEVARMMPVAAALKREAARQKARKVSELDFDALAREALLAISNAPAVSPLDPDGDGLETRELNAANDL